MIALEPTRNDPSPLPVTAGTCLVSQEDASVNWVTPAPDHGIFEARYVRRNPRTVVVYLSSQSGCAQACRFCHLTATGQTRHQQATVDELLRQARQVLAYYDAEAPPAEILHYNFMARGEPLDNPSIVNRGDELLRRLSEEGRRRGLFTRSLFSTILPASFRGHTLQEVFPVLHPEIYYSIYSMDPIFRRRWLPRALPPEESLALLQQWQYLTAKIPKLHYCFIEGENDDEAAVRRICEAVNDFRLRVNVNLIRYNPHSEKQGREPAFDVIQRNARIFAEELPLARVQVVTRIGYDVNASCGMFVE